MTFPGAGARVFYNEEGEPLGWDYPDYDSPPEPDDDDYGRDAYPERPGYCNTHDSDWYSDEVVCEGAPDDINQVCEQPQYIG